MREKSPVGRKGGKEEEEGQQEGRKWRVSGPATDMPHAPSFPGEDAPKAKALRSPDAQYVSISLV
jgi:hypothetical protein